MVDDRYLGCQECYLVALGGCPMLRRSDCPINLLFKRVAETRDEWADESKAELVAEAERIVASN